ncbi:MAG: DUF1802 family protein [Candidatus Nitrosocosmicus sp.]
MFYRFSLNSFPFEDNIPHRSILNLSSSSAFSNSSSSLPSNKSFSSNSKTQSLDTEDLKDNSSLPSIDKTYQSNSISVAALKEWAIVCKAIEDGKQVLLFRKGGIMEYRNGFELKHKVCFLFPTFEHQSIDSVRSEYIKELEFLQNQQQPQKTIENESRVSAKEKNNTIQNIIKINSIVEITYFNEINDINKLKELEKFHIWNIDYVKMRFNYNPKKPLYLLLLRAHKLKEPINISNRSEWSGCKSWIQFDMEDEYLKNKSANNSSQYFEYLKSISNPCIDDTAFNSITLEVRNILK